MFALLVVYAILRKPLPRIADPIPIEALTWAHASDVFVWVDKNSNQINIRNYGCTDLDLTYCTISAESSNEEDRPEEYKFPEGYRLAANSVVSIVCGNGAASVYVPEKLVARLDSRTCPRLAWDSFSTTNFMCDSASLFDASANCIVCDSTIPRSQGMSLDNSNDDDVSDPSGY